MSDILFGPVASRRFGKSLGIDLSPARKQCNFDCVYCELDPAPTVERAAEVPPVEEILDKVLWEIQWFITLQQAHPKRFFHLFADTFDEKKGGELAEFLRITPEPRWLERAPDLFSHYPGGHHEKAVTRRYRDMVAQRFEDFPTIRERLLALAP